MKPPRRAEINRRNSAHSTGPVTAQGKQRASLNALRHGLTGQTVVLPSDDMAAYEESCRQFHAGLKPEGILETKAVQVIADTHWRLDRIRAQENNLFALSSQEQCTDVFSDDPVIQGALAQAKAVQANADVLLKLSLYEQRLNRTLLQAKAELKQLQKERRETEKMAFPNADRVRKLKQALGQPWKPEDGGFEFSSARLAEWKQRSGTEEQAHEFNYRGRLPRTLPLKGPTPDPNPAE